MTDPVTAPSRFGLLVIGDEILSGKRQDKHLPKVIELLRARGLALSWARYLGDDRAQIRAAIAEAHASGDIVFSCGGIGATPDDHTRQAAAEAFDLPLQLHPQAAERIRLRMQELAAEQGLPCEPERPDNVQRLQMGCFPAGAALIENPYNRIPGFQVGRLYFVPGFPVMAHPMIEAVLDGPLAGLHGRDRQVERSVIVIGAMESALTPLMEALEAAHPAVRVFSLPSVDHPQWGRHIELGLKGPPDAVTRAWPGLIEGLQHQACTMGPEMVRES